ncbi:Alpha-ketoglutarate-dependent 2,4-dichlorophenoxyacetate dioxygenase [Cladophialophora carrionii]|uniref:Alpha-ketoglutarate-dependent 2,4-dichlorophenoxyacetate dioxygenase n=1 Tax=Cladophialophora carrionii TaxID=86049 RepID=A0A1C1C6M1_9EURO|nr:Alpha-ketoglutarate-dependent 2,4-dichlorophenoxyacetate dioxygenase [Cladophialophora carrionii]
MPGLLLTPETEFKTLKIKKLHPTFAAEIEGVDFSKPLEDDVFREILAASAKYGVIVFRKTGLDDTGHVEFSRRFGELDDIRPYMTNGRKPRYGYYELFDAGNIDPDTNTVLQPDSPRAQYNKGNALFHVDSSFNPRRASYSILKAHELPPPNTGGNTGFADTRTAWDELDPELKAELLEKDYVGAHSLYSSRKKAAPDFFKDLNVNDYPMHKHKIVQKHEPSGRMNLYIAAHMDHIVGVSPEKSKELMDKLMAHATQDKYTLSIPWHEPTDLVIWDNTCVMHRAEGGSFAGKYRRDLRRTTVHDDSSQAWGLNKAGKDERPGFALYDL